MATIETTILDRSNKTLNEYVAAADAMAVHARKLEAAKKTEKQLRNQILEMIGDTERLAVTVNKVPRVLTISRKDSNSRVCSDAEAVAWANANGLEDKISVRNAEYLPPATFTALIKSGIVPDDMYEVTTEKTIVVT